MTLRAEALRAGRDAASAVAEAGDDDVLAGDEDVRRADDAVECRLSGAEAVVEEVLGRRVVDGDDRVLERAFDGHLTKPDDAGRRLFGAADHRLGLLGTLAVDRRHEVGAVVDGEVRLAVEDLADVRVVRVVVLTADREDADAFRREVRGGVVLRRQRVATRRGRPRRPRRAAPGRGSRSP